MNNNIVFFNIIGFDVHYVQIYTSMHRVWTKSYLDKRHFNITRKVLDINVSVFPHYMDLYQRQL